MSEKTMVACSTTSDISAGAADISSLRPPTLRTSVPVVGIPFPTNFKISATIFSESPNQGG
jgi:hypothetical protein